MRTENEPNIFQYADAVQYLRDVYDWKKASLPGFSYASWAQELGFKSRSFLRLVLTGKRAITEKSIRVFAEGLKLKGTDRDYFEALARLGQAKSTRDREALTQALLRINQRTRARNEILDHYQFVSSPLLPRLQTLLSMEGIERTPEFFAKTLQRPLKEVQDALALLERLGLASAQGQTTHKHFEVKDHFGDHSLQAFHRKSLEESIQAIHAPKETRKFQSAIFCLTQEEYAELQQMVTDFATAAFNRFAGDDALNRRIYQLNLNLIPVSEPILREEKSSRAPVGSYSQPISKEISFV